MASLAGQVAIAIEDPYIPQNNAWRMYCSLSMQQDEPQYELVKVDFGGDSLSPTNFVVPW